MIVSIDGDTALRLLRLVGTRLVRLVGRRYPNPISYDSIELVTEGGTVLKIELRMEDVSEKLEVSCITAREVASVSTSGQCDDLWLADFRVDHILVLRRAEWLGAEESRGASVGTAPQQQHFGNPSDAPAWLPHALVDAGLLLVDDRGAQLVLLADAFPMVMQLRYS